jgi:hypothetical protein
MRSKSEEAGDQRHAAGFAGDRAAASRPSRTHSTWRNRTPDTRTRRAYDDLFRTDRRATLLPHSVERYGIKIGDPIDIPVTPIAWPRAAGDLPEPPDAPISTLFAKAVELGAFPDKSKRTPS